jgi:hypothetical protein
MIAVVNIDGQMRYDRIQSIDRAQKYILYKAS